MTLEFGILGPLRVRRGDQPVDLRGEKPRAVLALLLTRPNRSVPVSSFAVEIWEKGADEIAGNLQVVISNLRRTLGADAIRTDSGGYSLQVADDALDLDQFRALRNKGDAARTAHRADDAAGHFADAVAQWHGERVFEDIHAPFADSYADSIDRDHRAAQLAHAEALVALDRPPMGLLTSYARRFPLDAGFCSQLLIALVREGRDAEAAEEYHRFRERYDEELGANAPQSLRTLWASLARGEVPPGHYDRPGAPASATLVDDHVSAVAARLEHADGTTTAVVGRLRIGRTEGDLVLADPKVSKDHAVLSPTPEGFVLTDLHSTNGTFVNSLPVVMPTLLADGDRIRLGDTEVVFRRL